MTLFDLVGSNISERLIEEYLFCNPRTFQLSRRGYVGIERWLKRQYVVPNGRLDLLGQTVGDDLVVVEIKNTQVNGDALAQVCRYAYDIRLSLAKAKVEPNPKVFTAVVGPSFTESAVMAAEALDVSLVRFDVELSLNIAYPMFTDEGWEQRDQDRKRVGDDISSILGGNDNA